MIFLFVFPPSIPKILVKGGLSGSWREGKRTPAAVAVAGHWFLVCFLDWILKYIWEESTWPICYQDSAQATLTVPTVWIKNKDVSPWLLPGVPAVFLLLLVIKVLLFGESLMNVFVIKIIITIFFTDNPKSFKKYTFFSFFFLNKTDTKTLELFKKNFFKSEMESVLQQLIYFVFCRPFKAEPCLHRTRTAPARLSP